MLRDYEAVLKAAADPNRVRILKMLETGEMCVCQIVAVLELSQSTVSKHLSLLRAAGLVDERKDGRWVHIRLSRSAVNDYARPLLRLLREWLAQDPTVRGDAARVARVRKTPVERLCAALAQPAPPSAGRRSARSRTAAG
jgi:DNA-binding transcriptional ArsR family regulator